MKYLIFFGVGAYLYIQYTNLGRVSDITEDVDALPHDPNLCISCAAMVDVQERPETEALKILGGSFYREKIYEESFNSSEFEISV